MMNQYKQQKHAESEKFGSKYEEIQTWLFL